MIIQTARPWLVTVEIRESFSRVRPMTIVTGILPRGVPLRPRMLACTAAVLLPR